MKSKVTKTDLKIVDEFAKEAMCGLLVNRFSTVDAHNCGCVAELAYEIAMAMLEKKKSLEAQANIDRQ